jgi:MFS family permease
MARPRIFYGWWIVAAGVGMQFLTGALFTQLYGAYVVALRDDLGWSKGMLSGAYSANQVQNGFISPFQGALTDRFGPRGMVRIGVVILGIGFLLFSQVHSPLAFFGAFAVIGFGASFCGYLSLTTAVVNWFERRRATAISFMTFGFAMGGLAARLVVLFLEEYGWRTTAMWSGVVIIVLGLPLAQLMRHRPADYGLLPDGGPPAPRQHVRPGGRVSDTRSPRASRSPLRPYSAREAIRTRQFWYISLGHGSALLVVSSVAVHFVPHLHDNLHVSLGTAQLMFAMLTLTQALGTLVGGLIGDRWSKRGLAVACMAMHASALVVMAYAPALWVVVPAACTHGLAWGIRGPLMAAMRADYFGPASFGAIFGISSIVIMMFSAGGPLFAGLLADRTGNYESAFTIIAILALCGSLFFVLATPPRDRREPEPDRRAAEV